jgi:hypothetical protein
MSNFKRFSEDLLVAIYQISREHANSTFIVAREAFDRIDVLPAEHDQWEALDELDRKGFIKAVSELGIPAAGRSTMVLGGHRTVRKDYI